MQLIINAALSNKDRPEYGCATLPFPLPDEEYAHCMEILEALEIGGTVGQDCQVAEIISECHAVKRLQGTLVNVDGLDHLAKRLDSIDYAEAEKYEAMAHLLDLHDVRGLVNLTFCCQQVTVISDFGDLKSAGLNHFLTVHSGCAGTLEPLDFISSYRYNRNEGGGHDDH